MRCAVQRGLKPTLLYISGGQPNAYLQVIGEIVVYAIESSQPPPIKTADGTQARRVMSGQLGTRLGGQLITLVGARAAR